MKKILPLLIIPFLFFSCNEKVNRAKKEAREKYVKDSIAYAEAQTDSLIMAKLDRLSKRAWGDANFGISKKEALKTNAFKNVSSDKKDEIILVHDGGNIPGLNIGIKKFDVLFKMDQLYRIEIQSNLRNSNYIEEILCDTRLFSDRFTQIYGAPLIRDEDDEDILNYTPGRQFTYNKWKIKSKYVEIILGKTINSEYYYHVNIENFDYPLKGDSTTIVNQKEEEGNNHNHLTNKY